jgi:hypothetical protein
MDSTAQKHLSAITAGEVTKSNVIGIRKAMNHVARLRAGWSGNRSNATALDVSRMVEALRMVEPRVVDGALCASGLKLLQSPRYAKRLAPVADIIAALDTFRLVRFDPIGDGLHVIPIYRATATDGRSFLFRNIPWQSGGNGPEIVTNR